MKPNLNPITPPPEQPKIMFHRPRWARRSDDVANAVHASWLILLFAIFMNVLEGSFRKWVFPESGMVKYALYFSKDIIFAAILFYPIRSQASSALQQFGRWLVLGCWLMGMGAAVSCVHGLNPVGALLTSRALVFLPVIAWLVVPRLSGLPLRWVVWLLAAATILNFGLGTEQNRLPADHILNRYADADVQVVAVDSGVRASGSFAYISGMAVISSVGIWTGLALMSLASAQWQRIAAWAVLAASFGCGLASVSRGPIVVDVAILVGWMAFSQGGFSSLIKGMVAAAFCMVLASGIGLMPVFSGLSEGLMDRSSTAGDSFNERAFGQIGEMVAALEYAPLGRGFGTEQVGGQYYATGVANFNHFESPLPRLVVETGALGLVGYLVVCAGAILALQSAKHTASSDGVKAMLLATQLLLAIMFYSNVIFNHTASAFTWIIFAAVMAAKETNRTAATLKTVSRNGTIEGAGLPAEGGNGSGKRRRPKLGRAIFSVTATRDEDNAETMKPENGKKQSGREPLIR